MPQKSSLSGVSFKLRITSHVTTILKIHLSSLLHRYRKGGMYIPHENCFLHSPYNELLCYTNSVNLKVVTAILFAGEIFSSLK